MNFLEKIKVEMPTGRALTLKVARKVINKDGSSNYSVSTGDIVETGFINSDFPDLIVRNNEALFNNNKKVLKIFEAYGVKRLGKPEFKLLTKSKKSMMFYNVSTNSANGKSLADCLSKVKDVSYSNFLSRMDFYSGSNKNKTKFKK